MSCGKSDINKHDIFRIFVIENIVKTVFFQRFLGYVICKWSHFNDQHTTLTLIYFRSVGHLECSHFNVYSK